MSNKKKKLIYKGLELAGKRLVKQKKRDDQNLVLYRDGKVVVVPAREL